jgi:hypothetical protein
MSENFVFVNDAAWKFLEELRNIDERKPCPITMWPIDGLWIEIDLDWEKRVRKQLEGKKYYYWC